MRIRLLLLLLMISGAGCTQPDGPAPSLAPRPSETIDPRIPVEGAPVPGVVDPALASRLSELVAQARAGDAAFELAAAAAERLIAAAGAPQSESWVAAQQAVSAAVAARAPTTRAIGDIDELAAAALAEKGWISPADQEAIRTAAALAGGMERAQAARLDLMQARLAG